jgi:hypothetical protein
MISYIALNCLSSFTGELKGVTNHADYAFSFIMIPTDTDESLLNGDILRVSAQAECEDFFGGWTPHDLAPYNYRRLNPPINKHMRYLRLVG